jgi:2-keto-4-pentenoate hydratase
LFNIDHPFFGPVFQPDVYESGARIEAARFQHLVVEAEFALRLGRDLPPRASPYARDELIDAVDAVIPAIELISPRFAQLAFDSIGSTIGDCAANGGEVLGASVRAWCADDLPACPVRLLVQGREVADGDGSAVLGSPVNVLEWTVNAMSAQGIALRAGQFISTGTCTGIVTVKAGEAVRAEFGAFGSVEFVFV